MFTKFAKASIVGVKSSPTRLRTASLAKFSDYDDYRTDDGFMYVRVRAISSRVNKNHDGWPSDELAKSFRTFIGKPIFIDHHNHDPQKARGVVVDAALHVEDLDKTASLDPYYSTAPENHKPPTWVELLMETDAKTFPKLAKAVIAGDIDGVSMGCNVERSRCSVCSNWARSPEEYCKHIISKGAYYDHKQPDGTKVSKRSYEDCYDIGFFEISYVFDPADETALIFDKKHAQHRRMVAAAVRKEADNPPPQSDMTNIPQEVDTLRQEQLCPICGSMMDDGACETCNYQEPPQGFDNPDLEQAKEISQPQPPPQPEQPAPDPSQQGAPSPVQPAGQGSPMPMASSYNTTNSNGVTNKMEWRILEKTAAGENSGGRINTQERPILPVTRQTSDKPVNAQTVTNPAKPVEATNKGEQMKTADGTGATPAGEGVSADERVDVLGVGAVADNAEQGTKHENVEKEVGITGPHTDTWHGDEGDSLGQHEPVTDDVDVKAGDNGIGGPIGSPVSSIQVMADGTWGDPGEGGGTEFPDHEPSRIDLLVPIAEPVGDHTMTFPGDDFHIRDPITNEDANDVLGGPMGVALSKSEIKTHIFRAMKIAEVEVDLGLTPPTDKYERAAELEEEAPAALVAREETLSRVKTAGLGKTAKTAATASRMPSMRTAGVEHEAAVSGDEGLFL